jgi:hypothetical protein
MVKGEEHTIERVNEGPAVTVVFFEGEMPEPQVTSVYRFSVPPDVESRAPVTLDERTLAAMARATPANRQ